MPDIYEMQHKGEVAEVLDHFRLTLANSVGVTVTGNQVTLRSWWKGELVDLHMAILRVTTPSEAKDQARRSDQYREIIDKYKLVAPNLEDELLLAELGELPK